MGGEQGEGLGEEMPFFKLGEGQGQPQGLAFRPLLAPAGCKPLSLHLFLRGGATGSAYQEFEFPGL